MNAIKNACNGIVSDEVQERALQTAALTGLASVCAYAGTFFFTAYKPVNGAFYLGSVILVSHVAYQVLEKMKEMVKSDKVKYAITSIQLLQIPVVFYLMPGQLSPSLTSGAKLEIIIATAHFVAVPIFFHLGLEAWKDPTFVKVAPVAAMMLTLTQGLRSYIPV